MNSKLRLAKELYYWGFKKEAKKLFSDYQSDMKEKFGIPDENYYERLIDDVSNFADNIADDYLLSDQNVVSLSTRDSEIEEEIRKKTQLDINEITPEIEQKLEALPLEDAQAFEKYYRSGLISLDFLDEMLNNFNMTGVKKDIFSS